MFDEKGSVSFWWAEEVFGVGRGEIEGAFVAGDFAIWVWGFLFDLEELF